MLTHKFSNITENTYVSKLIDQLNTDEGKKLNNEQALRVLIDLTDELRRTKRYSSEHQELILKEVEKRFEKISQ